MATKKVGDLFTLMGTGEFSQGVDCIIMELSPEDGRIIKARAVVPDERLGRMGFILEGDDYVIAEWRWSEN